MSNSNTEISVNSSPPNQFNYGGQAVIEGVMMRGSKALAVAVRNPEGEIVVHTEPLNARIYGGRMARTPFVRGLTLLWDALGLGIKSLMFSADVALDEGSESESEPSKAFEGPAQWGTVLLSLSFSILLFFVLPTFVAHQLAVWLNLAGSQIVENGIEGLIRLALLIGYIWSIGLMPDIKRLYGYHGAEHKTINAYEAGAELTPASVAKYSLEHPRCGTAFLLTVVIISILIYSLLPPLGLLLRIVSRIVLLPVIAGIAYEFLRFTAAHQDKAIIRFITKPNLALQRLTTREPDESMLEVGIAAFMQVLTYEQSQQEAPDTTVVTKTPVGQPVVS
ncbi:MAG: DUF1385 domain-containing protein [Ardenticatenaceae bacterium]|nr:DUF1385 domain-containing protein [Ardenticatenaceae bacterium]MCB9444588.1 DUF1385 domain-containing protein [Ardenticatenaceae bacterium]